MLYAGPGWIFWVAIKYLVTSKASLALTFKTIALLLNSYLPTFRFRRQPNFCWTLCESTNWRRICLGDLAFPRRSKKASGWLVSNRRPKVLPLLAKFSPTNQKILEEEVIKEEASPANADQIALHQVFLKFHLRFIQTISRQQAMSLLLLMARK